MLELLPGEHLTESEIAAASSVAVGAFNAQQQRRAVWPVRPAVARAYLDQLARSDTLGADRRTALSNLLDRVDQVGTGTDPGAAAELTSAAQALASDSADAGGSSEQRLRDLAETLRTLADRIR